MSGLAVRSSLICRRWHKKKSGAKLIFPALRKPLKEWRREEMAKLLIIDECASVRELTAEELAGEGHLVVAIGSPTLSRELITTLEPDLVVLDLHMNRVDRWDVLEEIKRQAPYLPVIIFSSFDEGSKDPRLGGADGYVMKSFWFEKLKQKVAAVLHQRSIQLFEVRKDDIRLPLTPSPAMEGKNSNLVRRESISVN
jgi:CheY-like chemotaxis protein